MTPWQITDQNVSFYFLKDLVTGGSHNKDRKRAFDKCQLVFLLFSVSLIKHPLTRPRAEHIYTNYFISSSQQPYRAVCMLVTQLCPTVCDPMDYSLPGSSVYGILQARILEWIAILFSRGSSRPRDWTQVSFIASRFFTIRVTREAPIGLTCPYFRRTEAHRVEIIDTSEKFMYLPKW